MTNPQRKCTGCKARFNASGMIKLPAGYFHSIDCSIQYAQAKQDGARGKQAAKSNADARRVQKAERAKHRADKDRIKKRTGKNGHYQALKVAFHYYVKHVLRKGEPCYTCGKQQSSSDAGGAFHVGHFIPAKEVDPRRFMSENVRIQCYSCNAMNSGRRAEYRMALIDEMGAAHVGWLEAEVNHPSLKERYPDIDDIKKEAAYYRKLTRTAKNSTMGK